MSEQSYRMKVEFPTRAAARSGLAQIRILMKLLDRAGNDLHFGKKKWRLRANAFPPDGDIHLCRQLDAEFRAKHTKLFSLITVPTPDDPASGYNEIGLQRGYWNAFNYLAECLETFDNMDRDGKIIYLSGEAGSSANFEPLAQAIRNMDAKVGWASDMQLEEQIDLWKLVSTT